MTSTDWQQGGFGLYLHWPFCTTKCPYCDFNSHVAQKVDQAAWAQSLSAQIALAAREVPGRVLQSIYFGGGTPSLMDPEVVSAAISTAKTAWTPANDIEVTLEANPGSVEIGRFRAFREAGVNRVSLGVQSLRDEHLQALGRGHTAAEARIALDVARQTFDRVSFDLIYARQHQTRQDWQAELADALQYDPDHLSLYQLTIEDGTVFGRRFAAGQLKGLPDEDLSVEMFLDTQDQCGAAGLPAYEVSNHAKSGQESRHNLVYWRSGDYVGVGPGAHGRVTIDGTRFATQSPKLPSDWLRMASGMGLAELPREHLSAGDRADEFMLMGLRLSEGVDLRRFIALGGRQLDSDTVQDLIAQGLLTQHEDQLSATLRGRMVLNLLLRDLLT
jgi:putative oxygen-independent coproporphyrinogen III oxidase